MSFSIKIDLFTNSDAIFNRDATWFIGQGNKRCYNCHLPVT